MSVEERVRQRVERALAEGPKHGTMPNTSVKLQETGPRGAWVQGKTVAPEHIERLAQAMMSEGVDAHKARAVAVLIAEHVRLYVDKFRARSDERDIDAADTIGEWGCLASAFREAFSERPQRAENFVQKNMREDDCSRRFLAEREAAISFFLALETAARKVTRPAHRPPNVAAQDLMRGAVRAWREAVGEMPSPPSKRGGDDERPHALHNILHDMVGAASAGHELAGRMCAQISASAFGRAYRAVKAYAPGQDRGQAALG